ITDLMQKCTSDTQADRNYILLLARNRPDPKHADKKAFDLASVNPSLSSDQYFNSKFQSALDMCFDWAAGAATSQPAAVTTTPASNAGKETSQTASLPGSENWVYLGHFSGGVWQKRYLNFPPDFDP